MLEIHALNARDNALLELTFRENPAGSGDLIRREISQALDETIDALAARGLGYKHLRTALTPQVDKKELALIFDTSRMGGWYGYDAAMALLPLLNKDGSHSILTGDILWKDQDGAFAAINADSHLWQEVAVGHTSQLYAVYVTNLSPSSFESIVGGIASNPACVGFADCTFNSTLKTMLSTYLGTAYVKYKRKFISQHPFDSDRDTNENAAGWPVEEFGYECVSIDSTWFDLFLSYKIERAFETVDFNDGPFSLATVAGIWKDPRELPMFVDEARTKYLAEHKAGSLAKADLSGLSAGELADQLQAKLATSYIYNLRWDSEIGFSTFAAMIEVGQGDRTARLRAVLKYEDAGVELVTLFG
jgi:hypothetical protein